MTLSHAKGISKIGKNGFRSSPLFYLIVLLNVDWFNILSNEIVSIVKKVKIQFCFTLEVYWHLSKVILLVETILRSQRILKLHQSGIYMYD